MLFCSLRSTFKGFSSKKYDNPTDGLPHFYKFYHATCRMKNATRNSQLSLEIVFLGVLVTSDANNYFPMQSFFNAHLKLCKHLINSILRDFPKEKSSFGGQTGDCIFAKKPIKSAKTHFF